MKLSVCFIGYFSQYQDDRRKYCIQVIAFFSFLFFLIFWGRSKGKRNQAAVALMLITYRMTQVDFKSSQLRKKESLYKKKLKSYEFYILTLDIF